jgi:hypothetical protein
MYWFCSLALVFDCAFQRSPGLAARAGSEIKSCSVLAPTNALDTRESQKHFWRRLVWEPLR